ARGKAVEGADVYAIVSYHGGIRMYEKVKRARTNRQGRWEIKGEGGLMFFSGHLLVHKAGHPPAAVLLKKQGGRKYDLVLPSRGGGLEVRVLRDGKPLAKAAVKLDRAGGAQLYSPAYVGSDRGPERGRAEALLSPVTRTDVQ